MPCAETTRLFFAEATPYLVCVAALAFVASIVALWRTRRRAQKRESEYWRLQTAFWCGGNLPWSGVAASPSFENIRVRAPIPGVKHFGWHFYRYNQAASVIRNCTINAAGSTDMTGIYSYDGPPVEIGNCTFVNFPESAAVQVQSSQANHGMMAESPAVIVEGLALDESFTNAWPLARFEAGTNYVVTMRDCLTPTPPVPPHVPDFMEGVCVTNYFTISPGGNTLRVSLASNFFDNDGDSIPDIWEYVHGLSHTNRYDASADIDGDYLTNAQEFLFDCDPFVSDSSNCLFAVAARSIDERISGLSPTNALNIYNNYPSCGTNLVRNSSCWAYGLDLSCASPWNGAWNGGNRKTGTLISRRHIVYANHYAIGNGSTLYFVGTNGVVYSDKLISSVRVGNTDIQIGLIQHEISTNCVPACILPQNYSDYIGDGRDIPVISFDQEEKALIQEINNIGANVVFRAPQADSIRYPFYERIVEFDSSNPSFVLVGNQPILLCTFYTATSGPSIVHNAALVQQAMDSLCPGYELQEADFSQYRTLPDTR